ncbi:penicillin acylase family protein [Nodularia spumigena CS-591/04]|uniref:Uncharacterized protein n=1 Tax=Nodularia spumigena CENA596 TaxID=1819295 RepID=A0A161VMV4_NODSP|nr:penicillin acylase family protein [Nodularia spumigena]KZL48135.1 hypothetical protein A2T98_19665 [Nodularia spumigena CENA596]MDB9323690.1 penicillin acylase family protein [Nodularia spumigena CS-591/07A]MDB9327736.1 penicillin acylase family protein [Nodularia spumigena CS-590/02]MDB9329411.1 penicillin acylase family protein [Nodularia spumigena CS-591/04]MDB9335499.1 penicillin acylase family protein [Nodularia spumigena CS-590/01]
MNTMFIATKTKFDYSLDWRLVGIPVLAIAFNDNLGWTHTVNTHDGWDAYELKLQVWRTKQEINAHLEGRKVF